MQLLLCAPDLREELMLLETVSCRDRSAAGIDIRCWDRNSSGRKILLKKPEKNKAKPRKFEAQEAQREPLLFCAVCGGFAFSSC